MPLLATTERGAAPRPRRDLTRTTLRVARELGLLSLLYVGYMAGRSAIGVHSAEAQDRGHWILDTEHLLGLDLERPVNAVVAALPPVGLLFAYLYATLHYVVTPAVLVWVAA